jgi:hypothetical protein
MLGPYVPLQEKLVSHILAFRNNADLGKEFPGCMIIHVAWELLFFQLCVFSRFRPSGPPLFSAFPPHQRYPLLSRASERLKPQNGAVALRAYLLAMRE